MWGIVPAAGIGSRIQPLAFSKELLPVGSRFDGIIERPRAVSEYLIERMITGGAKKICMVISPGKSDIIEYYGNGIDSVHFCYMVQAHPQGLCDAIFSALPLIPADEPVIIGLPDTIWFPEDALQKLPDDKLSFLLFPVENPELFDAVVHDDKMNVIRIDVKKKEPGSKNIWGAFKMPGYILHDLNALWLKRNRQDEYFGTLINAYIENGNNAIGVAAGKSYVDVGTLYGYREAIKLLAAQEVFNGSNGAINKR
jgi:glucose-1-phosphate thymidylyltransferase